MRSEIKSLTGLRGIAACWVMIGHYFGRFPGNAMVHTVVSHMYVAVDLFMILSGFVLAMTYEDRFSPAITAREYIRFVQARVARLFPLYALVTAICLLMMEFDVGLNMCDLSLPGIAANFLMVQAWWWPDDSLTGTGWSLSIEWGANLLFPVFVLLLLRASNNRAAIVAAVALVGLAWLSLSQGQLGEDLPLTGAIDWYYVPNSLIRCGTEFALGMYCWRLRSRAVWTRSLGRTNLLLAVLAGVLVTTAMPSLDVAFVILSGCLVVGLSFEQSWLARCLGSAVPRWLGLISFSIYLLHLPLLPLKGLLVQLVTGVRPPDSYEVETVFQGVLCMVVVLGLSTLSFYSFEKPMQRRLRRLFTSSNAVVVGQVVPAR